MSKAGRLVVLYVGSLVLGLIVGGLILGIGLAVHEPPADPRAGITCMDDAGGGVYCWEGKP